MLHPLVVTKKPVLFFQFGLRQVSSFLSLSLSQVRKAEIQFSLDLKENFRVAFKIDLSEEERSQQSSDV